MNPNPNSIIENLVEELYIEHLEDLMQKADLAVRYKVRDEESYYEELRAGSGALLEAIRQALTRVRAETLREVEEGLKPLMKREYVHSFDIQAVLDIISETNLDKDE